MSTIESRPVDQFSHSDLPKVAAFCQYIHDNWTPETGLTVKNFAVIDGRMLIFYLGKEYHCCIHLDKLDPSTSIGEAGVIMKGTNEEVIETIPLRHIAGNY